MAGGLLGQINAGKSLKKASSAPRAAAPAPSGGGGDLLSAIRGGASLKKASSREIAAPPPAATGGGGGLQAALAQSLAKFRDAIEDEEDMNYDDNDDWD